MLTPIDEPSADKVLKTTSERENAGHEAGCRGMESITTRFVALFWIFLAFAMLNLIIAGLSKTAWEWGAFLVTTSIPVQIALLVTVAGLMGSNWLEGVLLAGGIAACLILAIVVPLAGKGIGVENLILVLPTIPLLLFVGAFPLILMRWIFGWRLQTTRRARECRERLRIETMVLLPASLSAMAVLASSTSHLSSDLMSVDSGLVSFSLVTGVVCLMVLIPMIGWAFRITNSMLRWLVCVGYPMGVALLTVLTLAITFGGSAGEAIPFVVGYTFFGSVIFVACLQVLRSNDYRLSSFSSAFKDATTVADLARPEATEVRSPFDSELKLDNTESAKSVVFSGARNRYRVAVGAVVLLAAAANFGAYAHKQAQYRQLFARIVAEGGAVEMVNGRATSLHFGPSTSDTWLVESPIVDSVKSISLAGTMHKHLWGMSKFPALQLLDLRDSLIDSASISSSMMSTRVTLKSWEGQFSSSEVERLVAEGFRVEQVARLETESQAITH